MRRWSSLKLKLTKTCANSGFLLTLLFLMSPSALTKVDKTPTMTSSCKVASAWHQNWSLISLADWYSTQCFRENKMERIIPMKHSQKPAWMIHVVSISSYPLLIHPVHGCQKYPVSQGWCVITLPHSITHLDYCILHMWIIVVVPWC